MFRPYGGICAAEHYDQRKHALCFTSSADMRSISWMKSWPGFLFLLFIGLTPARAVLFDSTGDPTFNTTAPGGALAGSGWQFQGDWLGFLGTPIAPNYFISAAHIGGSVGDIFTFGGVQYTTTAVFNSPTSDLRIWQVSGTFPTFAPIYTGNDEVGKSLVVFGRGTQRGAEVSPGGMLKGWSWGTSDSVQRWGTNVVSGIYAASAQNDFLVAAFDHGFNINEAHLSTGDSGGAVFIQDAFGTWSLAGINYGVDGPYALDSLGNGQFDAALFDQNGYYLQNSMGVWEAASGPGNFYATRISSNSEWIASVIPEPDVPMLLLCGLSILLIAPHIASRRNK
jgi:hypothetical protein